MINKNWGAKSGVVAEPGREGRDVVSDQGRMVSFRYEKTFIVYIMGVEPSLSSYIT